MGNKMKVCESCGVEKSASEFSKSYKNRCKECVAEQTRAKRAAVRNDARQTPDFWNNLLYQYAGMALSAFLTLTPTLSPKEAASTARAYAAELVEQMRNHTLKARNSNGKSSI